MLSSVASCSDFSIKIYYLLCSLLPGHHMTSVAIVGSRTFKDYALLKQSIDGFYPDRLDIKEIVSGGAQGADRLAERYAREYNLKMVRLVPTWYRKDGTYNPRAGFERNKTIVERADHVIAFWDGESNGTRDSCNHAKRLEKRLDTVMFS